MFAGKQILFLPVVSHHMVVSKCDVAQFQLKPELWWCAEILKFEPKPADQHLNQPWHPLKKRKGKKW